VKVARGELDRSAYGRLYGHRGAHEFEVSIPRPAEDPTWIDEQLKGLAAAKVDPMALLGRREEARKAAWARLAQNAPREVAGLQKKVERWAKVARDREAARSESIRCFWLARAFVLAAGEFTGQGADLFFTTIDEILALLGGDASALAAIPARRATYERYAALPTYPTLILGRFDPMEWAKDPQRRTDVYDATAAARPSSDEITGFPGAAGIVCGVVRVLRTPEEGAALEDGEILVTTVTNIGWTPLFPRAAAVVTDVGAPLSHAAIVARELGIPAVVGCGNATMKLHTGDSVRVDGERGTVSIVKRAAARD
jgi:pyruvate,water dikinase